jgi:hypothetical protein
MEHTKQGRKTHFTNFQEELYFRNLKKGETFVAHVRDRTKNNLGSKTGTGPIFDTKMEGTYVYLIVYFISLFRRLKKSLQFQVYPYNSN